MSIKRNYIAKQIKLDKSEISLCHAFSLADYLLFQFAHFFNEAVVVALDDVIEVGWAILHKEHIKQKPKQVSGRIHHAPVPIDFSQTVEVHGVAEVIVHA